MDDELSSLEAELHRLRPIAPPQRLRARVEVQLANRPKPRVFRWAAWSLPAAAAIMLAAVLWSSRPAGSPVLMRTVPASVEFLPVGARNVLIDASDDGVLTLEDGTPARRYRERYLDTITWRNPRTRASFTWTIPREEVRVHPISYQ